MAINDPRYPERARAAQDVDGESIHLINSNNFHGGRGVREDLPPAPSQGPNH